MDIYFQSHKQFCIVAVAAAAAVEARDAAGAQDAHAKAAHATDTAAKDVARASLSQKPRPPNQTDHSGYSTCDASRQASAA